MKIIIIYIINIIISYSLVFSEVLDDCRKLNIFLNNTLELYNCQNNYYKDYEYIFKLN
eukprot:jgi/Orpsp1_1/1185637/evm.model.c7180000094687.1